MFSQSVRAGLRTASRASVRAMSTAPVRAVPRVSAALAAGVAVTGLVAYKGWSYFSRKKASQDSKESRGDREKEEGADEAAYETPALMAGEKTIAGEKGTSSERSFVMIKPDGVSRQLVGKIVSRFEERGYKLVAIKSLTPSPALAKEHYIDLASRPFYAGLVKYITSGTPVVAMVWEGKDVIRQGRRIVGATNPLESDPGSVRGQYAVSVGRNLIHASDSFDAATTEIGLWFAADELSDYKPTTWDWVMADN